MQEARPSSLANTEQLAMQRSLCPLRRACGHEREPVVWWMTALEHFLKNDIRITLAAGGSQRVFVINPGINDDLGFGVKPEKQPKPSPNLGPPPVPERRTHGVALPVLLAIGITWHGLEHQLRQGIEKFKVGVRPKPFQVLGLRPLRGGLQLLELLNQTIVEE